MLGVVVLQKEGGVAPLPDRLFQHQEAVAVSRITTKHQLEEAKMQDCTFKPRINPGSGSIMVRATESHQPYRPIHERLGDIQVSESDTGQD